MRIYPFVTRISVKSFLCGLLLTNACMTGTSPAITIANEGTTNPTFIYRGTPMFKVGPLPEVATFAFKWGSDGFRHRAWLDWMSSNGLGYGRVYPESGYAWLPLHADGRILPFEVARWEEDRPIVDLTRFNQEYWDNMAKVIKECAERGIVLQMQLSQRVYFEGGASGAWATNYFNSYNNVNGFHMPGDKDDGLLGAVTKLVKEFITGKERRGGYGLMAAMPEDTVWRDIHSQWVVHVLNAIGDSGNVIIDLMNEGSFNKGTTKKWIEFTLDIIEGWEKDTGNDLLVGMDFDHFYKTFVKTGDAGPLEYILSHPRLDVIIAEGAESHVVPYLTAGDREPLHEDLVVEFRRRYRKPVISTNSPSYGALDDLESLHVYQWYALMTKVQGVGVYAKQYAMDLDSRPARTYAERARILNRFFERLEDYAALVPVTGRATSAPAQHRLILASSKEAAVYLYAGETSDSVAEGAPLALESLDIPDGQVSIVAVDPRDGNRWRWQGRMRHGALVTELPAFDKDLALHIVPTHQSEETGG